MYADSVDGERVLHSGNGRVGNFLGDGAGGCEVLWYDACGAAEVRVNVCAPNHHPTKTFCQRQQFVVLSCCN
jgi:hypothetical protein